MQVILRASLLLSLCAVAVGQSDRQAIEHYEANFEKYLGTDITLMVSEADRLDKGEHGDVSIFRIYTLGQRDSGFAYAVVPRSETASFVRRYAFRDYNTRPLRGTFMSRPNGTFYISFRGAKYPENPASGTASSAPAAAKPEAVRPPVFDDSPMQSFSYDGKRLIEATIIEITPDKVRLIDKHDVSVEVPLDRAIKMPDLRMKAKDAMEAAMAQVQTD